MEERPGLTLAEVVMLICMVLVGMGYVVTVGLARAREQARSRRCRGNLNNLAKGLATYLAEHGDNRYFPWPVGRAGCGTVGNPSFGGAEWLAALYWTRTLPDPGIFICPSSLDSNWNGRDLGAEGCSGPGFEAGPDGKLMPDAVSYAALGHTSVAVYERVRRRRSAATVTAIPGDFPPDQVMGSDDTEGAINHGRAYRGMSVLFFDSHVEFWPDTKIDLECGVGMKGTELEALRN